MTSGAPLYRFLWLPNVTRQRETPSRIIDKTVKARAGSGATHLSEDEAWLATIDTMLLSRCHILVGQMTSTLFRSAISLRAARCDCAAPYVSLDAPFCSDYGLRSGVVNHSAASTGAFYC